MKIRWVDGIHIHKSKEQLTDLGPSRDKCRNAQNICLIGIERIRKAHKK